MEGERTTRRKKRATQTRKSTLNNDKHTTQEENKLPPPPGSPKTPPPQPETQNTPPEETQLQQFANIIAQAITNTFRANPPPSPPRATTAFAFTPTLATNGTIDYTSDIGKTIFHEATKSLYQKNDDPFDGSEANLTTFLNRLSDRSHDQGWNYNKYSLLSIPSIDNNGYLSSPYHNLIQQYGQISTQRIRIYEQYIYDHDNRVKQQLYQLYKCLMNSLSVEGDATIKLWKEQFIYPDENGNIIHGGLSLLKIIIRESSVDANASTEALRRRLTKLDEFAMAVKGNIPKINAEAKLIQDGLHARGHTTTEMLTNLFKAYDTIQDQSFARYIANKKDAYEEGTSNINAAMLMKQTSDKYKTLRERGEWNEPTQETAKLMALEAQVADLKGKLQRKHKHTEKYHKKEHWKDKQYRPSTPPWLHQHKPPRNGETKEYDKFKGYRLWNQKKFWYCAPSTGGKCNGRWGKHHPKYCNPEKYKSTRNNQENKRKYTDKENTNDKGKQKPKPTINAYATLTEESG